MKKVLLSYPDIVNLDGTYCINNLGFPCYVFMVADGENSGQVVAYALVKDETAATLTFVLEEFKKQNSKANVKTFIVDKDAAEIAAIKAVFTDIDIILCKFHVINNFKDAASKFSKNYSEDQKIQNDKSLKLMLSSTVEETFYQHFNCLTPELKTYISKNWLPIMDSWARHRTKNKLTYGSTTNNIVESHNRILKTFFTKDTTLPQFIKKIIDYHTIIDRNRNLKIIDLKLKSRNQILPTGTPDAVATALQSLMPLITNKALSLLLEQIEYLVQTQEKDIVTDTGVAFIGSDKRSHSYDCSNGDCQCVFFLETRLPCWHMMLYRMRNLQEIFQVIPDKWQVVTLAECTEVSLDDSGTDRVRVTERKKEEEYCLNELEKRVKASDFCKSLVNVLVSCGTRTFFERMEVLKSLEESWRTGREVKSLWLFPAGRTCGKHDELEFSYSNSAATLSHPSNLTSLTSTLNHPSNSTTFTSNINQPSNSTINQSSNSTSFTSTLNHPSNSALFTSTGRKHFIENDHIVRDDGQISIKTDHSYSKLTSFSLQPGSTSPYHQSTSTPSHDSDDETKIPIPIEQCSKPIFNLVKKITKRGRPKGSGSTISKKKKTFTVREVFKIEKDPFQNVKQGIVMLGEDENVCNEESTDLRLVCRECGKEKVSESICTQNDFCEMVMCDFCHGWYHEVCVTGSVKVHRGMKFRCSKCQQAKKT